MKATISLVLFALGAIAPFANGSDVPPSTPAPPREFIFEERDGIVAVEAEAFYKQTKTEKRAFYLISAQQRPTITPDSDDAHLAGASQDAYVEILPDTRATHDDALVTGDNFSNEPGLAAILHYKVYFHTPGRYYVWCRTFSTGTEDNGVHVGIDGTWPPSGRRWQTTQKNAWSWDSRQRTPENHSGEPFLLYLDVPDAGLHEITFSMREDGFELDKWVLAQDRAFKPTDFGPASRLKSAATEAAP